MYVFFHFPDVHRNILSAWWHFRPVVVHPLPVQTSSSHQETDLWKHSETCLPCESVFHGTRTNSGFCSGGGCKIIYLRERDSDSIIFTPTLPHKALPLWKLRGIENILCGMISCQGTGKSIGNWSGNLGTNDQPASLLHFLSARHELAQCEAGLVQSP